jgi:gluconate kinase
MIVHLNGWPGVGKKTIGAALAERLHARFIHNHLLHDVAITCAGLESPDRWTLYEQVREAAYVSLRKCARTDVFVMTNGLCKHNQREIEAWGHVVSLAVSRQVPLVPVVLEASPDENARRVKSAERVGKKLSDPAILRSYFEMDAIQYPAVSELLVLDVTDLMPAEAAEQIEKRVKAIERSLRPATFEHLHFR